MAIKCNVFFCKYNEGGWCKNGYIEIKDLICQEYEPRDNLVRDLVTLVSYLDELEKIAEEIEKRGLKMSPDAFKEHINNIRKLLLGKSEEVDSDEQA